MKTLQNKDDSAINEAGPEVLATPTTPDRNPSYYPRITTLIPHNERADSAQGERADNLQSIGDLARRLVEKSGGDA